MAPSGLAIILGAGPVLGHGIARALASPQHSNLAIALLARRPESLSELKTTLQTDIPDSTVETFPTDTSPTNLEAAFAAIASHPSFASLPLRAAIYNVKSPSRVPYLEETAQHFTDHVATYVGGAFAFSSLATKRLLADHGSEPLSSTHPRKKGTIIFTGVTGALKCNANFAAYGAARAGVRQLAQSMGRELSGLGVHVVHTVVNGVVVADEGDARVAGGEVMSARAAGEVYAGLVAQGPQLWSGEVDLRPAQEKF